jgi:hypothetical protein
MKKNKKNRKSAINSNNTSINDKLLQITEESQKIYQLGVAHGMLKAAAGSIEKGIEMSLKAMQDFRKGLKGDVGVVDVPVTQRKLSKRPNDLIGAREPNWTWESYDIPEGTKIRCRFIKAKNIYVTTTGIKHVKFNGKVMTLTKATKLIADKIKRKINYLDGGSAKRYWLLNGKKLCNFSNKYGFDYPLNKPVPMDASKKKQPRRWVHLGLPDNSVVTLRVNPSITATTCGEYELKIDGKKLSVREATDYACKQAKVKRNPKDTAIHMWQFKNRSLHAAFVRARANSQKTAS